MEFKKSCIYLHANRVAVAKYLVTVIMGVECQIWTFSRYVTATYWYLLHRNARDSSV